MTTVIILLALIAVEMGLGIGSLMVLVSLRDKSPGDRPSGGAATPPSVSPTSEEAKIRINPGPGPAGPSGPIIDYGLTGAPDADGKAEQPVIPELQKFFDSVEADRRAEEAEKRRQDAINNILGYDITTARKAARHDAGETE